MMLCQPVVRRTTEPPSPIATRRRERPPYCCPCVGPVARDRPTAIRPLPFTPVSHPALSDRLSSMAPTREKGPVLRHQHYIQYRYCCSAAHFSFCSKPCTASILDAAALSSTGSVIDC